MKEPNIWINYHFVHGKVPEGAIKLQPISSSEQATNFFPKRDMVDMYTKL